MMPQRPTACPWCHLQCLVLRLHSRNGESRERVLACQGGHTQGQEAEPGIKR